MNESPAVGKPRVRAFRPIYEPAGKANSPRHLPRNTNTVMILPILIISLLVLFLAVMASSENPADRTRNSNKSGHSTGKANRHAAGPR